MQLGSNVQQHSVAQRKCMRNSHCESSAQITTQQLAEESSSEIAKIGTSVDTLDGHLNFRSHSEDYTEPNGQSDVSDHRASKENNISYAEPACERMSPSKTEMHNHESPAEAREDEVKQSQFMQAGFYSFLSPQIIFWFYLMMWDWILLRSR